FMEKLTAAVTGNGTGTIPFNIGANGKFGLATSEPTPTPTEAPPTPVAAPETPAAPPTAFERLYPGVDPSKVEFFLDEATNKLKYREIAQETPTEPAPTETEPTLEPTTTPSEPSEIAQLRTQLDNQNQLMQAMLIAQAQGKPLAEVLGLQP